MLEDTALLVKAGQQRYKIQLANGAETIRRYSGPKLGSRRMFKHVTRISVALNVSCAAVATDAPLLRIQPCHSQQTEVGPECSALRVLKPLEDIQYPHSAVAGC
jgi:hypothetical protein